jgi:hypothetical protein
MLRAGFAGRFLRRAQPSFDHILLIESGQRRVVEQILPYLYGEKNARRVDLLTCYSGSPSTFDANRGTVFSVHDPEARRNRRAFIRKLSGGSYDLVALLCTGSPILEKWKWTIALLTPARLILVNESAKYFGLDIWNLRTARLMLFKRLNPFADADMGSFAETVITSLIDLLLTPFVVGYLLLTTAVIHLCRLFRMWKAAAS